MLKHHNNSVWLLGLWFSFNICKTVCSDSHSILTMTLISTRIYKKCLNLNCFKGAKRHAHRSLHFLVIILWSLTLVVGHTALILDVLNMQLYRWKNGRYLLFVRNFSTFHSLSRWLTVRNLLLMKRRLRTAVGPERLQYKWLNPALCIRAFLETPKTVMRRMKILKQDRHLAHIMW